MASSLKPHHSSCRTLSPCSRGIPRRCHSTLILHQGWPAHHAPLPFGEIPPRFSFTISLPIPPCLKLFKIVAYICASKGVPPLSSLIHRGGSTAKSAMILLFPPSESPYKAPDLTFPPGVSFAMLLSPTAPCSPSSPGRQTFLALMVRTPRSDSMLFSAPYWTIHLARRILPPRP